MIELTIGFLFLLVCVEAYISFIAMMGWKATLRGERTLLDSWRKSNDAWAETIEAWRKSDERRETNTSKLRAVSELHHRSTVGPKGGNA